MTRQPSLKSKRRPIGPGWVGISAAAGSRRFSSFDAAATPASASPALSGTGRPGSVAISSLGAEAPPTALALTSGSAASNRGAPDRAPNLAACSASFLDERPPQLLHERLHQEAHHRALAGLHEHFRLQI